MGSQRVGHDWGTELNLTVPFFWILQVSWLVHAQMCPTLWDPVDYSPHQIPLSMEFSRQECWSVLPFPSSGHLPDPGIIAVFLHFLHWQMDSLPTELPRKPRFHIYMLIYKIFFFCFLKFILWKVNPVWCSRTGSMVQFVQETLLTWSPLGASQNLVKY